MNPLHSPRKEHSKTEFGKKNSENRRLFLEAHLVLWPAWDSTWIMIVEMQIEILNGGEILLN